VFGVTILGNNSAIPAFDRHPTAQAVVHEDQVFLVDCGEGTQMQLSKYKIRRSRINHIFISHLHGDHFFGLMGVITSFGLLGREQPLYIYGPAALEQIIQIQIEAAGPRMGYPLHFVPVSGAGLVTSTPRMEVYSFPVQHRIACFGYLFREKRIPRKLDREKAIAAGIPAYFFNRLQMGENYENKYGEIIENETVTTPNLPGRSYAYCADTIFLPELADVVKGVNLLYHEATYLSDLEERAKQRYHSSARQAATIAGLAQAGSLIIGHFSSKYEDLSPFEQEAKQVFAKTQLALEGATYRVMDKYPEAG
jgi:ribonuclease Z